MRYKALKNFYIEVKGEEMFCAAPNGSILCPPSEKSKIFLHWLNENGKLLATHTLMYPTLVEGKLKIISPNLVKIYVIDP